MTNPMSTPAAINHNPLNMRPLPGGQKWNGQLDVVTYPGTGSFCRFVDNQHGVRAAAINMTSLVRVGNRTLKNVIQAWTGTKDQPQSTIDDYLGHVCEVAGVSPNYDMSWLIAPNQPSLGQIGTLAGIIEGMNQFEAGRDDYGNFVNTVTEDEIIEGLDMAFNLPKGYERGDDGNKQRSNVAASETIKATDNGKYGLMASVATGTIAPVVTGLAGADPIVVAILAGVFLIVAGAVGYYFLNQAKTERVKMAENGVA